MVEGFDEATRDRINRFTEAGLAGIAIGWDLEGGAARERFATVIRRGCALTFLGVENIGTYFTREELATIARHQFPRPADTRRHGFVIVANMRDAFCHFAKEYSGLLFQSEVEVSWFVHRCIDSFEEVIFLSGAAPASEAAPRSAAVDGDKTDHEILCGDASADSGAVDDSRAEAEDDGGIEESKASLREG